VSVNQDARKPGMQRKALETAVKQATAAY